jgi:putative ABC transport system substrate-binding protein
MSRNHQSQSCAPGCASLASDEEGGRTSLRGDRMRRRDFTIGLTLAAAARSGRAQERVKQHRIAIVRPAGSVALISDTGIRTYRAFFEELRRLGDIEGQNLTVERYSGEGRPEGFAELARLVVNRNPDVIVVSSDAIARTARAATGTIPIVWVGGDPIQAGLVTSLARPGGNITGVTVFAGNGIDGKRLQLLKEALPTASRVAYLDVRTYWEGDARSLREPSQQLQISVVGVLLEKSTPSEYQRVFAEIAQNRPDAIMVHGRADLTAYHQLIVELANKGRLPAMYPWRDYAEAGGLMAYGGDLGEVGRRMADEVHEILNGAKPGDIPIYQPTKYELVINQKTAQSLGLTLPPELLAAADEVIE